MVPSLIWTGQIPFSRAITFLCWNASLMCKLSQQAAIYMLARTASPGKITKNWMISTSPQATLSSSKQHLYLFFYNSSCSTQFFLSPLNPFFSLPEKESPHSTALISSSCQSLVNELQITSVWVAFWIVKNHSISTESTNNHRKVSGVRIWALIILPLCWINYSKLCVLVST